MMATTTAAQTTTAATTAVHDWQGDQNSTIKQSMTAAAEAQCAAVACKKAADGGKVRL